MTNILKWELERSWLWGPASVSNIGHLREDLKQLDEALKGKSDLGPVQQLEQALKAARELLDSTRTRLDATVKGLAGQVEQVEKAIQTAEFEERLQTQANRQSAVLEALGARTREEGELLLALFKEAQTACDRSLAQCRTVEAGLQKAEQHFQTSFQEQLGVAKEGAASSAKSAEEANTTLGTIRVLRTECEQVQQAMRAQNEQSAERWQQADASLRGLSAASQKSAAEAARLAGLMQESLKNCQAIVEKNQEIQGAVMSLHGHATQRLEALTQTTEAQAAATAHDRECAVSASGLAEAARSECEKLANIVATSVSRWTGRLEQARQELDGAVKSVREELATAASAASKSAESASACQALAKNLQVVQEELTGEQEKMHIQVGALDEMVEQMLQKAGQIDTQVRACQEIHAQMVKSQGAFETLKSSVVEHVRKAEKAHDGANEIAAQLREQLTKLQLNELSFWKRLGWLLFGSKQGR